MATENPSGGPTPPHSLDLSTITKNSATENTFREILFRDPANLMLSTGHLQDLAQSPIASALIHASEIYDITDGVSQLHNYAILPGAQLEQRIQALSPDLRPNAMRILLSIMTQELLQGDLEEFIKRAEQSMIVEKHVDAQEHYHQHKAIRTIHEALHQAFCEAYQNADAYSYNRIQRILDETPWDSINNRMEGIASIETTQIMPVVKPPTPSEDNN